MRLLAVVPSLLLLCGCGVVHPSEAPPPERGLTTAQWREDLEFLASELPRRHKNLFFRLTREEFERQVKRLSDEIPRLSDVEVKAALAVLAASVGDIHTSLFTFRMGPAFPLRLFVFPEGTFVTAAPADHAGLVGARLIGINKTDIEELQRLLLPFIPKESPYVAASQLPDFLVNADALEATHILSVPGEAVYRFQKNGRNLTVPLTARAKQEQRFLTGFHAGADVQPPIYLSNRRANYWFRYLKERRILYLQYNACVEMPSLPFAEFVRQVMRIADTSPVEKFIIDLRHNGGGATSVVNPLLAALDARPALARTGRLFAFISRDSYSSAEIVAWVLKNNYNATLVGEPTAQRPNSYGDARGFTLPNSKLRVRYSTKRFSLAPGDPPSLLPDRAVTVTAADYFRGRDPVLDAVLKSGADTR